MFQFFSYDIFVGNEKLYISQVWNNLLFDRNVFIHILFGIGILSSILLLRSNHG